MEQFILTPEMVRGARAYLPIQEKYEFSLEYAKNCFDRLQIAAGDEQMPPIYAENPALKARYLMYVFVARYLGIETECEPKNAALMTEEEYDRFAGSHIFQQLERIKKSNESLRDKCFDLLADYYDLCRMFSTAVHGYLDVQNDIVTRQYQSNREAMEELPKLLETLKDVLPLMQKKEGEQDAG